jgi:hypothetical protein
VSASTALVPLITPFDGTATIVVTPCERRRRAFTPASESGPSSSAIESSGVT